VIGFGRLGSGSGGCGGRRYFFLGPLLLRKVGRGFRRRFLARFSFRIFEETGFAFASTGGFRSAFVALGIEASDFVIQTRNSSTHAIVVETQKRKARFALAILRFGA